MVKTEVDRQGFDLMTGKVVREISVPYLLSPGHHYRCYPSKATENYLLLPKRGVEFVDIKGEGHARHDWLRAPCAYGVMPANGILYMAPHQCVCYPGVLLPNFNALVSGAAREKGSFSPEPGTRLERGPAYGREARHVESGRDDWPVYRRDALRSGSTVAPVGDSLMKLWETDLGGRITPPVVAGRRLYVAQKDAHTLHVLDAGNGLSLWRYTAGGRIDSPPAVHGPYVLFGSADGWVYCLWAETGELAWRFHAAPHERQVSAFGQFESAWPVHGSVLIENDATASLSRPVVYFAAGRSSYLDGGIRLYGLDPVSGEVLHQAVLEGPGSDPFTEKGTAGYMDGSMSDILVSDGADIYLYQNRFRGDLTQVETPMQNLRAEGGGHRIFTPAPERGSPGRHLIPTAGFLDDSFNEGTFWTYSEKWPGWTRVMGGVPFYGQIMVFDDRSVYGANYYYEMVRVRRGIMPERKGYRIFARDHDAGEDAWSVFVPVRTMAMVLAGNRLFFAGTPDLVPEEDPLAGYEGRLGGVLWAVSADTGKKLAVYKLDAPPVFDGLIATPGKLFITTTDGGVLCLEAQNHGDV
jgi:outer membrane protein assembly factor BamB